eukprot:TRINITY_DN53_c0_g1_i6.p1 TRINITY_DN53_c0_g1~~TRINITY_DN53_c0_g1_i6.p1  ORF type:complete len:121 (+),score=24.70 TRINITY_DN53_c0_g1_i6:741-1103(+)
MHKEVVKPCFMLIGFVSDIRQHELNRNHVEIALDLIPHKDCRGFRPVSLMVSREFFQCQIAGWIRTSMLVFVSGASELHCNSFVFQKSNCSIRCVSSLQGWPYSSMEKLNFPVTLGILVD